MLRGRSRGRFVCIAVCVLEKQGRLEDKQSKRYCTSLRHSYLIIKLDPLGNRRLGYKAFDETISVTPAVKSRLIDLVLRRRNKLIFLFTQIFRVKIGSVTITAG